MGCSCNCECNRKIIDIRRGDDSNFNDEAIIFTFPNYPDLTEFSARIQLQDLSWEYSVIENNYLELVITREESLKLEPGFCVGYVKLIDQNGLEKTVKAQQFRVWEEMVPSNIDG